MKTLKKIALFLGILLLLAALFCIVVAIIGATKNMGFVEYINSWTLSAKQTVENVVFIK